MVYFNYQVMLFAFRYALGRSSASPSIMRECIEKNVEQFSFTYRRQIIEDIENAIEKGCAGDFCDVLTWQNLQRFLEKSMEGKSE